MIITLITDFGTRDYFVASMKGVILSINPRAVIVDITHEVPKYEVGRAAFILWKAYKWFPRGMVHVAVVDPGVGTSRRPIVIETKNYFFVGPDNGVLSLAAEEDGVVGVYEIEVEGEGVSSTFHGRDVFAPVAAMLSLGLKQRLRQVQEYVRMPYEVARVRGDELIASVVYVDDFGNVYTNANRGHIEELANYGDCVEVVVKGRSIRMRYLPSYGYADRGVELILVNSEGHVELAVNQGSFASRYGVSVGDLVTIRRCRG